MAISLYVLFLLSITFTLFSFMLERKLINAYWMGFTKGLAVGCFLSTAVLIILEIIKGGI